MFCRHGQDSLMRISKPPGIQGNSESHWSLNSNQTLQGKLLILLGKTFSTFSYKYIYPYYTCYVYITYISLSNMCAHKIWQMRPETIAICSFFYHFLYFLDFTENYTLLEKKTNDCIFNDKTFSLVLSVKSRCICSL